MAEQTPYDPLTATPRGPKKTGRKPKIEGERLNKFLASAGFGSRRSCETLILEGRVDIDGEIVTDLGRRVNAEAQVVRVDGERVKRTDDTVVLVLNKPTGYLSAAADPESRPLVYHLIPKDLALKSVGRLDFNTEGVLLFTNDGELAERLGHARYAVQRVYEARVRGIPSEDTLAKLRRGVRLEDGLARAESAEVVKVTDKNAWLRLTLLEGRNREVRRLLERVGHPVVRLRRVLFAGVASTGLALGQWRLLAETEIEQLRSRGHVGKFDLPPDPRRKTDLPGLSTGPAPSEKHTAQRRGAGRVAGAAPGQGALRKPAPAAATPTPAGRPVDAPAGRPAAPAWPSRPPPSGRGGGPRDGNGGRDNRGGWDGPAGRDGSGRDTRGGRAGGTGRDSAAGRGGRGRDNGGGDRRPPSPPRSGGGASSRKPRRES